MRQRTLIGVVVIIIIVLLAIFLFARTNSNAAPASETGFINGMQPIMAQTNDPSNFKTLEAQRAAMICKNINNLQVTDWIGTVDKVDTTVTGGAMLSISVMPNVDFGTAPNSTLNTSSNTLIPTSSPLYHTVSTLQPGNKVRFSGQLFASTADCIQESSSTMGATMQTPSFLTQFSSITVLPQSNN